MPNNVNNLIDIAALEQQIKSAIALIDQLEKKITGIGGAAKDIFKAGSSGSISEQEREIKKLVAAHKTLEQSTSDITKETIKYQQAIKEKNAAEALEIKSQNELISAYDRLKADAQIALNRYRDSVVVKGKDAEETKKLADESRKYNERLKEIDATVSLHQKNVGNYAQAAGGLRTQIRALREGLVEMELQGKNNTQQYKDMVVKLGTLQDAMGDVQARAKFFADDARWINASAQAVQGLVGAYSVFNGVAVLAGKENEELQKSMQKIQALMTIMMGLKQVEAMVNKDSMVRVGAMVLLDKLRTSSLRKKTVAIQEATAATVANTAAEKSSEAAGTKLTAQVASSAGPWGILVAAIVAAAYGMYNYWKWSQKATEASDDFRLSIELTSASINYHNTKVNEELDVLESYVNGLRKQGKTQKEIADEHIENVNKEAGITQKTLQSQIDKTDEYIKKLEEKIKTQQKSNNSERVVPLSGREGRAVTASETTQLTKDIALLEKLKGVREDYNRQLNGSVEWQKKFNEETVTAIRQAEAEAKAREDAIKQEKFYEKHKRETYNITKLEIKAGLTLIDIYRDKADALDQLNAAYKRNYEAQKNALLIESASTALGENRTTITEQYTDKLENVISEEEEILKRRENFQNNIISDFEAITTSTLSKISSYLTAVSEKELNKIGEAYDKNADYIKRLLDQGVISQEEYNARLEQLSREREQREKEERRRAAKQQKELALFQAIINTASGVASALIGDPYSAAARAAIVGALGAIEIAFIAAQPLPQFAKGTKSAPGGLSIVGERGFEYVATSTGDLYKTPNVATITNLGKGDRVYTHTESLEIDKLIQPTRAIAYQQHEKRQGMELVGKLDELTKAVKDKPTAIINMDKHGLAFMLKNGDRVTSYINNHIMYKGK